MGHDWEMDQVATTKISGGRASKIVWWRYNRDKREPNDGTALGQRKCSLPPSQ